MMELYQTARDRCTGSRFQRVCEHARMRLRMHVCVCARAHTRVRFECEYECVGVPLSTPSVPPLNPLSGRNRLCTNDGCRRGSAAHSNATRRPSGAARDCCAGLCVPADAPRSTPHPPCIPPARIADAARTHTAAHTVCVRRCIGPSVDTHVCVRVRWRVDRRIYGEVR
jgi:hypothetical protein